jgi:outer membrane protein TolC
MKMSGFLLCFIIVFTIRTAFCNILFLDDYLNMVIQSNSELQSVQSNINAVKNKLAQVDMIYSYSFNTNVSYTNDQSGRPYNPLARVDVAKAVNCETSISKQFATGTQVSLGLNASSGQYKYISSQVYYYGVRDIAPFVKLQQSLWKDINGHFTKSNIAKAKASARATLYLLEYKKQNILFNAKLTYWNLSYAKTVINFRKMSLSRTEKILEWNKKRYDLDLAEKLDLLQSEAAVKLRELNLKLAYEDESKANRAFTKLLNIKDEKIKYNVEKFEDKGNNFEKDIILNRKGTRADVLATIEDVKSAVYDQISSKKNMGTDLVLIGQFALNGVEQELNVAMRRISNGDKPSYTIGLKYTLPLDFKLKKTINEGYESAKISAQRAAEYAAISENNDWLQLEDNWNNARIRLKHVLEIEKIQKQRYEEDKNLLRKGRSTTYQVLQSEQALDDATLNVLQSIFELIKIYEQAEVFYSYNSKIEI